MLVVTGDIVLQKDGVSGGNTVAMVRRRFKVERENVAYVRHVFEGYEGLATVTTVNRTASIIELTMSEDFVEDVDRICSALRSEINLYDAEGDRGA